MYQGSPLFPIFRPLAHERLIWSVWCEGTSKYGTITPSFTPIGNSDYCSLSAVISMAQAVPNLCVSRTVFLKHQVNWNTVCGAIQDLSWCNICLADYPVEVLNEHLSLLLRHYVPTRGSVPGSQVTGIPCHFDWYSYPGISFQSRKIPGNNIPLFMHYT